MVGEDKGDVPFLELGGGVCRCGEGVGAEDGVKVGFVVGSGEDDGVDVLGHVGAHEVDLRISSGHMGERCGADESSERRHPVHSTKVTSE